MPFIASIFAVYFHYTRCIVLGKVSVLHLLHFLQSAALSATNLLLMRSAHLPPNSRCAECLFWAQARAYSRMNRHLDHAVFLLRKERICLFDIFQGIVMGDQRCGIYLSCLDQTKNLIAVAAIHAAGLKG